jgi:hypothetical protein
MKRSGNEKTLEFGRAIEQFFTGACVRCAGLLVRDWCYDLCHSGEDSTEIYRCVQCGYRVDPVILENQGRLPGKQAGAGQPHHHYSRRKAMWGKAA